jgi:hypothetical protein
MTGAKMSSRGLWLGPQRTAGAISAVVVVSLAGFVMMGMADAEAARAGEAFTTAEFLTQSEEASALNSARIKYQAPDGLRSLANGESIAISEDLLLTVSVSPYPPSQFDVDLDLLLTDAAGQPVENASIRTDVDMALMGHGPFASDFVSAGNGHFGASFDLFMFGPWEFVMNVTAPGHNQPDNLTMSVYVWPE